MATDDARATGAAAAACSGAAAGGRGVAELGGLGRPGTTRVNLDALPEGTRIVDSAPLTCHPDTGALVAGAVPKTLAPSDVRPAPPGEVEKRYRPSPALQRLVRLRDGHCRFPGCPVTARSCDLDHVIPWPAGPTTATNLICLCRRHHRVKQRPGWTARLDPDGIVHWTDPGGRATDTHPVDHLDRLHLPPPPNPTATARTAAPAWPDDRADDRTENPDLIPTLLELALTRLLHLAEADTRPRPPVGIEWVTEPHGHPVLVDLPAAPPPPRDDPPF
ncbi:HNH endonuclease signature motif containing protein [Knoellia sp. CPCC 206435]|uniref:HNH endonuclease signature motif containing protein n=1 Tax=Knoellia terrae TaxID=3404797 RepID=UPI003B431258